MSDLVFKQEENKEVFKELPSWKVLIVDDEKEVHNMTKLVLKGFTFENRPLKLLHAYSGEQAKQIIVQNPDIALILLDVVMEDDDTGLKLVKFVREKQNNKFVRIVLRTGQPGQAPESKVILDYNINDYKLKTDLVIEKLHTTIISSLRTYRDLVKIYEEKEVLKKGKTGRLHSITIKTSGKGKPEKKSVIKIDDEN